VGLVDIDRDSVLEAISEFDALGRDEFLGKYGFGRARSYFISYNGGTYDSKAIIGVAHQFAMPEEGPLEPGWFSGGERSVAVLSRRLGFNVDVVVNQGDSELGDIFQTVLDLQAAWSGSNTPEMQRRGLLVRNEAPEAIRALLPEESSLPTDDMDVEGRDGTGMKTRVPWVRVHSRQKSPSATGGWYVVYLFSFFGDVVYLSLNQGTTIFDNNDYQPRPREGIVARVAEARALLGDKIDEFDQDIKLGDRGQLGAGYELGNVCAISYQNGQIPSDDELADDLKDTLSLLDTLYQSDSETDTGSSGEEDDEPKRVMPRQRLSLEWLENRTLWSREALEEVIESLDGNLPQVILAGPPGTGKTWVAQCLAMYLTGDSEDQRDRYRVVQFHPSYGYEEFVEGLRPVAKDGGINFERVAGALRRLAEKVQVSEEQHVLVIDEMNRANLPSVFGELMHLLEYREASVDLLYSENFSLPKDLSIIGTMNTADRSTRSIDTALRRRFDIFECPPDRSLLERYYDTRTNGIPDLFDGFDRLNSDLTERLDRHHTIGHTFFMSSDMSHRRLKRVWKYQIQPLIEDYFFDSPDVVDEFQLKTMWPSANSVD